MSYFNEIISLKDRADIAEILDAISLRIEMIALVLVYSLPEKGFSRQ